MNKIRLEKRMYIFMNFTNVLFYISNIALFAITRQLSSILGIKARYVIIMSALVLVELAVLCVNSAMINSKITAFQSLIRKQTRIIYFSYIVLLAAPYFVVNYIDFKYNYYIYAVIWLLLFVISAAIFKDIYYHIDSCAENYEKDIQSNNEISIKSDELVIMQAIKKFFIVELTVHFITVMFCELIMNNIYVFGIFVVLYSLVLYSFSSEIFSYYLKNSKLISWINVVFAGTGWFLVRTLYYNYLHDYELEEVLILQIPFLIPCMIWMSNKYRTYQTYTLKQIKKRYKR